MNEEKTLQQIRAERKLQEKMSIISSYTPSDTHPLGTRKSRRTKVKRNPRFFKKSPRND